MLSLMRWQKTTLGSTLYQVGLSARYMTFLHDPLSGATTLHLAHYACLIRPQFRVSAEVSNFQQYFRLLAWIVSMSVPCTEVGVPCCKVCVLSAARLQIGTSSPMSKNMNLGTEKKNKTDSWRSEKRCLGWWRSITFGAQAWWKWCREGLGSDITDTYCGGVPMMGRPQCREGKKLLLRFNCKVAE